MEPIPAALPLPDEADAAPSIQAAPAAPPPRRGWPELVAAPLIVAGLLHEEAWLLPDGHGPSGIGWAFGVVVASLLTVASILMAYDAVGAWTWDDGRPDGRDQSRSALAGLARAAMLAAFVQAPCRVLFLLCA